MNIYIKWQLRLVCFLAFNFCRFCVVICFFHPRHNDPRLRRISILDFIHYIFSTILILEKEPLFPFFNVECAIRETTGTIFLTSLVWCGPWPRIEPGTCRTRRQHSTTRLSRRRYNSGKFLYQHYLFCMSSIRSCLTSNDTIFRSSPSSSSLSILS